MKKLRPCVDDAKSTADDNLKLMDTPTASEIKKHVQLVRNDGEYVTIYPDGRFSYIIHGSFHKAFSFEQRIQFLKFFHRSKHDLSACYPDELLCFYVTKNNLI